jgi:hypothetical protein
MSKPVGRKQEHNCLASESRFDRRKPGLYKDPSILKI